MWAKGVLANQRICLAVLLVGILVICSYFFTTQRSLVIGSHHDLNLVAGKHVHVETLDTEKHVDLHTSTKVFKEVVDNSGATEYLKKYRTLFNATDKSPLAQPNRPETISKWWEAAAMIDWYINSPLRHKCQNKIALGNWGACQDPPYTVKPPCLVYSFGINFDFSFDDAAGRLGCEVHSFDPSMGKESHNRSANVTFHNLGLGNTNTNGFMAREDIYVKGKQLWKLRTLKSVMKELGHQNHVIDILKIDVEGHEWNVIDNMMETGVFPHIRQFMLEFHLFPKWPVKEDYVYLYNIYRQLREMGFHEFSIGPHVKTLTIDKFNNQGDSQFVNANFHYK